MENAKILVVDDEARMRKLVRDFLSAKGYEILEAGDGEEAVKIFMADKSIDLIIMDVMRMGGSAGDPPVLQRPGHHADRPRRRTG